MTDTSFNETRDLTTDDRSTVQQAVDAMRTRSWRQVMWTLLGLLVASALLAGGMYWVLETLSGYWMGR